MKNQDQTLPPITIIPAGAGSGKTYTVQQRLGEWVEKGLIEPQRIIATTFTEAAATELRERIRARLLELGRMEDALKLDQAYISTIHGFGLKILTEFAFEAGTSPQPRMLNEEEQKTLIKQSLAHTTKAKEVIQNLESYGYKFDFNSKKGPEDLFRDDVLSVIDLLRSIGWQEKNNKHSKLAIEWIESYYGHPQKGDTLAKQLHNSVMRLLTQYPHSLAEQFGTNDTAIKAFKSNFRDLKSASNLSILKKDWSLWQRLRELRLTKRGCPVPEDYEDLAQQVMDAANQLPFHHGPLLHAGQHIETLLETAQEVLQYYSQAKLDSGLVDFTDMIAMSHTLLSQNQKVLDTMVDRIDCLVVDEFQDTNPLQFSLLWLLKEAGIPTLIVGDLKQAIMGFQGADARLFSALEEQFPDANQPLTQNWRSQPKLMDIVNAIGPVLFEDFYTNLEPKGLKSELQPLEFIDFHVKAKKDQHKIRAYTVGKRLLELLESQSQFIQDRRTNKRRLLKGGDIAILAPTTNVLNQYAQIFRAMGIKVKLQEDGWQDSREIQIALQALAYVSNPNDRHAALYLSVTELGQSSLKDALSQLMTDGKIKEPLLEKLDLLSKSVSEETIYSLVVNTLKHMKIFDAVLNWPDAQQARANLLRLQSEASDFMQANREALATGGCYGSGIQSFLAWLTIKVDDNDKKPVANVIDEDAIELVTWHSSKGREWPVVVVTEMERKIKATLPELGIGYQSFDDLLKILSNTQIEYSPMFAAPESNDKFLDLLQRKAEKEAKRVLYVALTRARDKLIIEWPSYLKDKTNSYIGILTQDNALTLTEKSVKVGDDLFPCKIYKGYSELPDSINLDEVSNDAVALKNVGRCAIRQQKILFDLTAETVSPSMLKEQTIVNFSEKNIKLEQYSDEIELKSDLPPNAVGTAVHRLFEVLGTRPDLIEKVTEGLEVELEKNLIDKTLLQINKFESWIESYFQPNEIFRELPFISINENGSVVNGTVDMVLKNKDGIVIIDHKTDQIDDSIASLENYRAQLFSYAKEISKSMGQVHSICVHWIRKGQVVIENIKV